MRTATEILRDLVSALPKCQFGEVGKECGRVAMVECGDDPYELFYACETHQQFPPRELDWLAPLKEAVTFLAEPTNLEEFARGCDEVDARKREAESKSMAADLDQRLTDLESDTATRLGVMETSVSELGRSVDELRLFMTERTVGFTESRAAMKAQEARIKELEAHAFGLASKYTVAPCGNAAAPAPPRAARSGEGTAWITAEVRPVTTGGPLPSSICADIVAPSASASDASRRVSLVGVDVDRVPVPGFYKDTVFGPSPGAHFEAPSRPDAGEAAKEHNERLAEHMARAGACLCAEELSVVCEERDRARRDRDYYRGEWAKLGGGAAPLDLTTLRVPCAAKGVQIGLSQVVNVGGALVIELFEEFVRDEGESRGADFYGLDAAGCRLLARALNQYADVEEAKTKETP